MFPALHSTLLWVQQSASKRRQRWTVKLLPFRCKQSYSNGHIYTHTHTHTHNFTCASIHLSNTLGAVDLLGPKENARVISRAVAKMRPVGSSNTGLNPGV